MSPRNEAEQVQCEKCGSYYMTHVTIYRNPKSGKQAKTPGLREYLVFILLAFWVLGLAEQLIGFYNAYPTAISIFIASNLALSILLCPIYGSFKVKWLISRSVKEEYDVCENCHYKSAIMHDPIQRAEK